MAMNLKRIGLVSIVSALVASAHGAPQAEIVDALKDKAINPAEVVISLERTTCLGSCPAYRITVHGSGQVEYEGRKYVKVEGVRKSTIEQKEVLALANEMLRVHFFDAANDYVSKDEISSRAGNLTLISSKASDRPGTILELKIGAYAKRVHLYYNYPQDLFSLADSIDRAVRIEQWIGSTCDRPRSSIGPFTTCEKS